MYVKQIRNAALDFAKALLVGVLLSAPFSLALADFSHSVQLTFYSAPQQHAALESWYREQPLVRDLEVRADAEGITIRYSARGMFTDPGLPPLQELGYTLKNAQIQTAHFPLLESRLFLITLLSVQAGFLLVGLRVRRRARTAGQSLPKLVGGNPRSALLLGIGTGAALFAFGWAYDEALTRLLPQTWLDYSPWSELSDLEGVTLVGLLAGGILAAPLCEELFFRGALFGRLAAAGHVRFGALLSALLFAGAHLDPWRTPAFVVYGLVLAALCRRSGALLAPFVAHALNNAAAFSALLLF